MRCAIAAVLYCSSLLGDPARDARVLQDLSYLVDQITARHPNPYTQVSREAFNARRQALIDAVPALTDIEAYLRMQSLVASIGDAHTTLSLDGFYRAFALRHFPLRSTLYDDGMFVTVANEPYSRYLGQRVVSINGRTPAELIDAIRPFVSYDNEQWLRQQFITRLRSPQLLHGLGLAGDPDRSTWVLEDLAGNRETLVIEGTGTPPAAATINDPAVGYLSPTYLDPTLNYWYRYYPEQNLLFFKYNVCAERPDLPFAMFAAALFRELDTKPVDHLVVDLRDNTGGNSEVWRPFLNGLQTRYTGLRRNSRFGFYGLISRLTFSSAMLAAQEIKRFAGALLVGEDTGGNPDSFGETVNYTLPNSGIPGSVSTKHFSPFVAGVRPPAVAADVRVSRDSADVFARFDPVLFRVFTLKDSPDLPAAALDPPSRIVSAASLRPGSPQAPNSLSTLFGDFAGVPATVATGLPLPTTLAGVEVITGGRSSPLLYVGPGQVNFQQPSGRLSAAETVELRQNGKVLWAGTELTAEAAPAIFISDPANIRRPGTVLNEDGQLNSSQHPAGTGEILQIFGTGYPELMTPVAAGTTPAAGELAHTVQTPTVWIGHWPMGVVFSGASSEFPGLWQINARIPTAPDITKLMPIVIAAEGRQSPAVTVWVR